MNTASLLFNINRGLMLKKLLKGTINLILKFKQLRVQRKTNESLISKQLKEKKRSRVIFIFNF